MLSLKKSRVDKTFFFSCSVIFYLLESVLSKSFFCVLIPNVFFKLLTLVCALFLFIYKLCDLTYSKYKSKELIIIAVSYFFLIFFYLRLGMKVALFLLFIIFSRNIRFEKIAKVIMVSLATLLTTVILCSKIGIISNHYVIERGVTREYMGFLYMLYPMSIMMCITFLYVYIYQKNVSVTMMLFIISANCYIYFRTNARLSFACSLVLIVLALLQKFRPNILKKMRKNTKIGYLMCLSYIWATILSVLVVIIYDENIYWMKKLNIFLENRIELSIISLHLYGIKLFGQNVEWRGNGLSTDGKILIGQYLYVDNFYLNYIQRLGIVPFIFLLCLITATLFKAYKKNDYLLVIVCFIESLHGILDDGVFSMRYFPFWLLCGSYIFSDVAYKYNTNETITSKINRRIRICWERLRF